VSFRVEGEENAMAGIGLKKKREFSIVPLGRDLLKLTKAASHV
jgi:hypothetical protein